MAKFQSLYYKPVNHNILCCNSKKLASVILIILHVMQKDNLDAGSYEIRFKSSDW